MTKDVPTRYIVGRNPARIIGKYDELIEKRRHLDLTEIVL